MFSAGLRLNLSENRIHSETTMSNNPYLHVIIRVPKSASTTLQTIVTDAFPNARLFPMLGEVFGDNIVSRVEKLRALRKIHRAVWKNYRVITTDAAWKKIDTISNHGDIVSGHFGIHEVKINNMERRNI